MRKHDEGYALLLVVVVLLVLSILAAGLMASAAMNVKLQRGSIDRMEARYAAQGEIEKVVAKLEQETAIPILDNTKEPELYIAEWIKAASGLEVDSADITVTGKPEPPEPVTPPEEADSSETTEEDPAEGEKMPYECIITVTRTAESASVTCQLKLAGTIQKTTDDSNPVNDDIVYEIKPDPVVYESYTIDTLTGGGGAQ